MPAFSITVSLKTLDGDTVEENYLIRSEELTDSTNRIEQETCAIEEAKRIFVEAHSDKNFVFTHEVINYAHH